MTQSISKISCISSFLLGLALAIALLELWFIADINKCHQIKHFQIISRNKALQSPKKVKAKSNLQPQIMKTDCYSKTTPLMWFQKEYDKLWRKANKLGT